MNERTTIKYDYDQEADVLYISFAPGEKASTAIELNESILLRFNRAEERAIGLTLMDFSVLVQLTKLGHAPFRFLDWWILSQSGRIWSLTLSLRRQSTRC